MKLCHTLVCFFFLSLQGGNPGLFNAEGHQIYKETEGANITVKCFFTFSGRRRFFCKQKCEDIILINTTADSAENGRYSIEFRKKYWLSHPALLVNITKLMKSDSGWYRCGLDKSWIKDSYKDFEIIVTDASATSEPDWNLSSGLGSFRSSSASPETTTQSGQQQTESTKRSGRLLSVGVTLAVKIVLLSLALLFFCCRRRASKPKEPPVETQSASVSQTIREYEEIREERQSRSPPPVEISSIYTCITYSKPNGAETSDDYSFVNLSCPTAAGSQRKAVDNLSEVTYSMVDVSRVPTTSLNRTTHPNTNDGIYSVLQLKANSDASHKEDASSPLYSTVTLPLQ